MKNCIILVFAIVLSLGYAHAQEKDMNVVYGDHHIFTIETPPNWINDKKAAQTIDLTNFFFCADDIDNSPKSYMYALGIDKASKSEDLEEFIEGDIQKFKQKYPDAEVEIIDIGHTPPIISSKMLSFDNLHDRYREEVVYLETEETVIVLSFAAFSESDYNKYIEVFDSEFIGSFQYRGNNPKPFLEWQKKN